MLKFFRVINLCGFHCPQKIISSKIFPDYNISDVLNLGFLHTFKYCLATSGFGDFFIRVCSVNIHNLYCCILALVKFVYH